MPPDMPSSRLISASPASKISPSGGLPPSWWNWLPRETHEKILRAGLRVEQKAIFKNRRGAFASGILRPGFREERKGLVNCPKCGRPMSYLNQDYRTHGWYCLESVCREWTPCDQPCCSQKNAAGPSRREESDPAICPRCFGSGNWPWAQWGGPTKCSACDGAGKISGRAFAKISSEPVDRRNPAYPPRPGMIWSPKHKMWIDVDRRSPEQKALHEKIAAEHETRIKKERS